MLDKTALPPSEIADRLELFGRMIPADGSARAEVLPSDAPAVTDRAVELLGGVPADGCRPVVRKLRQLAGCLMTGGLLIESARTACNDAAAAIRRLSAIQGAAS